MGVLLVLDHNLARRLDGTLLQSICFGFLIAEERGSRRYIVLLLREIQSGKLARAERSFMQCINYIFISTIQTFFEGDSVAAMPGILLVANDDIVAVTVVTLHAVRYALIKLFFSQLAERKLMMSCG